MRPFGQQTEPAGSNPGDGRSRVRAEGLGAGCLETCTPGSEEGKTGRPVYLFHSGVVSKYLTCGGAERPAEMMACKDSSAVQFNSIASSSGTSKKYPEVGTGVVGTYTHRITFWVWTSRQVPVTKAGTFIPGCGNATSTIRWGRCCPGCLSMNCSTFRSPS